MLKRRRSLNCAQELCLSFEKPFERTARQFDSLQTGYDGREVRHSDTAGRAG
jgi:hypothetical protein